MSRKPPAWDQIIERLPDGQHAAVEVQVTRSTEGPVVFVDVTLCRREPSCVGGHASIHATAATLADACRAILPYFDAHGFWVDR